MSWWVLSSKIMPWKIAGLLSIIVKEVFTIETTFMFQQTSFSFTALEPHYVENVQVKNYESSVISSENIILEIVIERNHVYKLLTF